MKKLHVLFISILTAVSLTSCVIGTDDESDTGTVYKVTFDSQYATTLSDPSEKQLQHLRQLLIHSPLPL